jgi:hypothetical protein
MKTAILYAIVVGSLMACPTAGLSQEPGALKMEPVIPAGPLLRAAPEFSAWVVKYVYADDKKPGATPSSPAQPLPGSTSKRPRQIVTTKTGRIVHEEVTDLSGAKAERWYVGSTLYTKPGDQSPWFQSDNSGKDGAFFDSGYVPLAPNGYRDCDGITPENFAGTTVANDGRPMLVFVPGGAKKLDLRNSNQQREQMAKQSTIACVDAEERRPIVLKDASVTRIYEFKAPPAAMQSLPPGLADAIRKGEEGRARLHQPPPRPY